MTDTSHTWSIFQWNQLSRNRASGQCTTTKSDNRTCTTLVLIQSLFPTDTDCTLSLWQSNRSTRSRTSRQCSTAKLGNTTRATLLLIQSFIHYFEQTITTFNLSCNQIDDQGAKHLASALQHNQVIWLVLYSTSHSTIYSLFATDTYCT
jgi:hypothetical protein